MLYFVSTPIGNLKDISYRAIETLNEVDVIACEDTRHSLKLLDHYGIKKQLISYHKFNEKERAEELISLLNDGKKVAVISDAGSPVISDPGNVLTSILRERGIDYTVIPGATAFVPALILSGLNASRFTFIGFLPDKQKDCEKLLQSYKSATETLIFYSAPHDVNRHLKWLYLAFGDRKVVAVKEITKLHETVYSMSLSSAEIIEPKGEFVILVEGATETNEKGFALTEKEHIDLYVSRGMTKKEAIKQVAKERGVSKNSLYKYTVED
ncbi:MAG: 16S rRNA (cytidine(1402)-2'-O)-methyltransferase [Clostridia bacterium]|nr:16S rRNA (cytidine(1402)-2'-O)-methyltransferase [Clostridia bacterium]